MLQKTNKANKPDNPGPNITPTNNQGRIKIQFMFDGQCYSFSPVDRDRYDNDLHLARARKICKEIEFDILTDRFDPTLLKYKPVKAANSNTLSLLDSPIEPTYNILELYLEYLTNNNPERERYNIGIKLAKRSLSNIKNTELLSVDKAYELLAELKKLYKVSSLRAMFPELRATINWHNKQGKRIKNPYIDITQSLINHEKNQGKVSKKTKKAATSNDIETIINAFRNNDYSSPSAPLDNRSYYTNMVAFLFATGCRPEDCRALEWNDIIDKNGRKLIRFNKAYTETGYLKSTKNRTIRLFPVNKQLDDILICQKQQNINYGLNDHKLIFPSKKGKYLNGANFQTRQFKPVIEGLLKDRKISKYVTTGNCRHSFITNMRSKGIPDAVIGALVETSTEMIESHYCDNDNLTDLELPEI